MRLAELLDRAGQLLGEWVSLASDSFDPVLVVGVLTACALVVIGLVGVRELLLVRALRNRVRVLMLPANEFDPTVEEVQRVARQLLRSGRYGWLGSANTVRVRIESLDTGHALYGLEVPSRSRLMLRGDLFGGVEMLPPDQLDGYVPSNGDSSTPATKEQVALLLHLIDMRGPERASDAYVQITGAAPPGLSRRFLRSMESGVVNRWIGALSTGEVSG